MPTASIKTIPLIRDDFSSAFGTLASRLEGQGLIERRPGRGRRIEHHLTAAGDAVMRAGQDITTELLGTSFAELSDPERTQLMHLLAKVGARMGELDPLVAR
jgi:DNA-binding MarR family transcriptional regulator